MSKIVKLSFLVLVVLCLNAVAMAQSTTAGAIGGVVTNPNKEVVAGAAVTVRNMETNKEDTATTDDQGRFKVVNLRPGNYVVTINSSGFTAFTQENVVVEVGLTTAIEANLSIGAVTGTVEVTAEAPVINTNQQDFSSNINQTSINELPINGRRASSFVLLTPGAVPDGDFGLISFRGISGLLNNSTVDGGNNNQAFFAEEAGRTRISSSISQAAVREFQVNTSNYSAEYGRAAGGVVNTVTKSGTNAFHGDIFYYLRDNKLGARNPRGFNPLTGAALKPVDRRHQFGGTIGGPIVKDKLFFFFSYDQQKRDFPAIAQFSSQTFLTTVNNANLTAASRGLTAAQITAATNFLLSVSGETPRRQDSRLILPKIDWIINSSNTFTFTYNRLRNISPNGVQTAATVTRGRSSFGDDFVNIDYGVARLSSTITPTLINEARVKIGSEDDFQFSTPPLPGEPTTGPGGRSPSVAITNGLTFGKPNFLERKHNPLEKNYQFVDNVTLSHGNHTWKLGADYLRTNDVLDNLFQEGGVYSYSNINDFIVDYTNWTTNGSLRTGGKVCSTTTRLAGLCYTSNFGQGFGQPRFQFHTTDLAYYAQDDWRWSPRLTVNLGVRYEIELMPKPQIPNPLYPQTNQFPTDKNNFGPRGGFAYDLTGDGKTSVRGGIGVYYGRLINSTISNAITNTGVDRGQVQFSISPSSTGSPAPPIFPNVIPTPASVANPTGSSIAGSSIVVLEPTLHLPTIIQGDMIIEREIARNTSISASYLTSRGRFLPVFINKNLAPATQTATLTVASGDFAGRTVTVPVYTSRLDSRFFNITEVRGAVESAYHALVLQANRRLTTGLQFQASYTLSRAKDTGQTSVTFTSTNTPTDPYNLELDRGRTNFNIPHRFVGSAVWSPEMKSDNAGVRAIFGGWTIAPIVTAQSGRPYSAGVSGRPISSALNASITGSGGNSFFLPLGRNTFKQPRIVNVDARLSRRFKFNENMNLEFLIEAFNLFNRTQITSVNDTAFNIVGSTLVPVASFGTDAQTGNSIFRERQVQWALRFHF
ncbi:MAG: TonB-dependent receptor domain-containing protein [Pyrinomonadaceae bacterium]